MSPCRGLNFVAEPVAQLRWVGGPGVLGKSLATHAKPPESCSTFFSTLDVMKLRRIATECAGFSQADTAARRLLVPAAWADRILKV